MSVRILRELKERLDKLNINVSEVIRGLLKKYVEKAELKRLEERLMRIRKRRSRVTKLMRLGLNKEELMLLFGWKMINVYSYLEGV
ncbi:MAG: hypothetical protein J7L38_07815 [Thermoproteales archaeon]|nr:hypothetical protein [Thermoproteales archaeon]